MHLDLGIVAESLIDAKDKPSIRQFDV